MLYENVLTATRVELGFARWEYFILPELAHREVIHGLENNSSDEDVNRE